MPKQMQVWKLSNIADEDVVGKPVVWMSLSSHLFQACLNYNKREPINPNKWAESSKEALRDAGLGNWGVYYLWICNREKYPDSLFQLVYGYEYVKGVALAENHVTEEYFRNYYGVYMKVPVIQNN